MKPEYKSLTLYEIFQKEWRQKMQESEAKERQQEAADLAKIDRFVLTNQSDTSEDREVSATQHEEEERKRKEKEKEEEEKKKQGGQHQPGQQPGPGSQPPGQGGQRPGGGGSQY